VELQTVALSCKVVAILAKYKAGINSGARTTPPAKHQNKIDKKRELKEVYMVQYQETREGRNASSRRELRRAWHYVIAFLAARGSHSTVLESRHAGNQGR
jgi:hypothetical protein